MISPGYCMRGASSISLPGTRFGMHGASSKTSTHDARPGQAGFTLIELIIVIGLVGILGVVALERLLFYQELAEKAAMESVLAATKMGLQIRMAEMIVANNQAQMIDLERENPMRWLQEQPANYAGEYRVPVKGGNWYFDIGPRQLVYAVNTSSHLQGGGQAEPRELRFRARLRYDDVVGGNYKSKAVSGISIVPAESYRWF